MAAGGPCVESYEAKAGISPQRLVVVVPVKLLSEVFDRKVRCRRV
jgi:hypothetical protein